MFVRYSIRSDCRLSIYLKYNNICSEPTGGVYHTALYHIERSVPTVREAKKFVFSSRICSTSSSSLCSIVSQCCFTCISIQKVPIIILNICKKTQQKRTKNLREWWLTIEFPRSDQNMPNSISDCNFLNIQFLFVSSCPFVVLSVMLRSLYISIFVQRTWLGRSQLAQWLWASGIGITAALFFFAPCFGPVFLIWFCFSVSSQVLQFYPSRC